MALETDDQSGFCLDEEQIDALVTGSLDEARSSRAHAHIATCDSCRNWLAMLVTLDRASAGAPSAAAADPGAADDPLIGVTLGRYQLRERIGRGASGLVYRAYDPSLERDVAVKLLRDVDNDEWRRRMFREARAMAKLSHPNIVPIFDVGEVDTDLFIAMELVEDGSMRQWLESSPGWQRIVRRFIDAGRGLAHIHASGFLHRDIKPENILVDQGLDRALIADLGLSGTAANASDAGGQRHAIGTPTNRQPAAGDGEKQTDAAVGTPAYLAPELRDEGARATFASDQFSFSQSLWEALGGTPGETGSLRDRGVPDRVSRVIARGLSTSPDGRHSSMNDMVAALAASLQSNRRRHLVSAATVAVVLVAAVALVVVLRSSSARSSCDDLDDRVARLWSENRRAAMLASFAALTPSGRAVASALDKQIASRLEAWRVARARVCVASDTKEDQASLLRAACLEDQLEGLETFVTVAMSTDERGVERAGRALARLPRPKDCDGERPLVGPRAPAKNADRYYELKREISALGTKLKLGSKEARSDLLAIAAAVEAVDSDALRADYAYLMGVIEHREGDRDAAREHFSRAVTLAETSGHDRIRALALAAIGSARELDYETALDHLTRAQAVLERVNGSGDFRADIELLVADVHRRHGKNELAREALERAKVAIEADEPVSEARLADVYRQMSATSSDRVANEENAREALALDRSVYGDESPQTVESLVALSEPLRWTGKLEEAVSTLTSALALHRKVYGDDHVDSAILHTNLCVTITDLVITAAPTNPDKDGLARAEGHCKEAIRIGELHADAKKPTTLGQVAAAHSALGRLYNASRRFEEGLAQYERAFELATTAKSRPSDMTSIHVGLASCLAELGRDLPRALRLLEETQAVYKEMMGPEHAASLDGFIARLREVVPNDERQKPPATNAE